MPDGNLVDEVTKNTFLLTAEYRNEHYLLVDPWLIVGLAAHCRNEMEMYEKAGLHQCSMQSDYMLGAMQTLAGLILYHDPNYFTFGPGSDEYMENTGQE